MMKEPVLYRKSHISISQKKLAKKRKKETREEWVGGEAWKCVQVRTIGKIFGGGGGGGKPIASIRWRHISHCFKTKDH